LLEPQKRIVLSLLLLLVAGLPVYTNMAEWPDYLFSPVPGLHAVFFTGYPSKWVLASVSIVQIVCVVCFAIGFKPRFFAGLLVLCFWFGLGFRFSLGKLDHGYHLLFGFFLIFSLFPEAAWNQTIRLWKNPLAIFFCFSYFTAGWQKLNGGWLNIDTQTTAYNYLRDAVNPQIAWLKYIKVWELLDYSLTLWELLIPLTLFNDKLFRLSLGVASIFHLIICLIFQISFEQNIWCLLWFLPITVPMPIKHAHLKIVFIIASALAILTTFIPVEHSPTTSLLSLFFNKSLSEIISCLVLTFIVLFGIYKGFTTNSLRS